MKIEFGGGETPRKPLYTQVDIRKINKHTIVCNAWEIAERVQAENVTNIYSRHFFEHLSHIQACKTLTAWYKICIYGARVELICPNMKFHIWQWQNWSTLTGKEKAHCRAGFWGWQRDVDTQDWDVHKSGYDFEKLKELVERHGFTKVKKLMPDGEKDPHLAVEFFK